MPYRDSSGLGADSLSQQIWDAKVFRSQRGDPLSLRRVAELISVWGYEIVLGGDEAFPAFHVSAVGLDFLRQVFRR